MLLALYQSLLTKAAKADSGNLPVGTLTFQSLYPQLRYGDVEGIGQVTIDQTGNMIGFSPVERCSANGETAWIPLALVRNIRLEPNGVPHTTRGRAVKLTPTTNGKTPRAAAAAK